jgi:4-amino-4-deoxychorismate lyase
MVGSVSAVPPDAGPALLAVLGRGVVDPATPVVAADDEGFTRGDGCFEGCRIVDGTVAKLDAHLARMARSAAALDLPFDVGTWRAFVTDCVGAWTEPGEAALKLVLSRGPAGGAPLGLLYVSPLPADYPRQRRDGIAVATLIRGTASSAYTDTPWLLGGVKTLSYAVNMAGQREARRRGADDAIFVSSDGLVLEAPTSSVVWAAGGTLHTTPLGGTGILGGTTQALLFARAADAGWKTTDAFATVDGLLAADSCWLVGTVRGPVDVVRIDGVARARDAGRTAAIRSLCGF